MKKELIPYMAILANLTLLLFTNCTTNVANGGTEVGNPRISAMLYNPGGSPAAHAKVKLFPVNYNPRVGGPNVDSTTTDATGNYSAKLDTGTYNILATGDSGVAYQDSIKVVRDSTVHPPADTLKAPGSIEGVVRLQPGDDARTVFMIFMGTNVLNMPEDAIGNFSVANMAEGTYRVRILTTLDAYLPKDTALSFRAGEVDTLAHDIVLKYTGIPVPTGLKVAYDTLKQIVTLTWNKPTTGRKVAGYNIYRKELDSTNFVPLKNGAKDTVFIDSTGVQDLTFEYKVAVIDTNNSEGTKSSAATVLIATYFVLDSVFSIPGSGAGTGNYTDLAIARNGNLYIVDRAGKQIQVFGLNFQPKFQFGNGTLTNPTKITLDSLNNSYIANNNIVFVFDSTGLLINQRTADANIFDIDFRNGILYAVTDGDTLRVLKKDGSSQRKWECGEYNSADWLTVTDSGLILTSENNKEEINTFDTLGNLKSNFPMPPYPYSLVFDNAKDRSYINCLDSRGNWLKVIGTSNNLLAEYKVQGMGGEPIVIGLHPNGSLYELLGTTGKILKIRSLLP